MFIKTNKASNFKETQCPSPLLPSPKFQLDVENKHMDTKGGGGGGMNWEIGIDMYTLICIKQIINKNLLYKKIK